MQPIPFKQQNILLRAGDNPSTDDMPIAACSNEEMSEGQDVVYAVSCWKLTPEELAEINRTGVLWLSVSMLPPPPFMIVAFDPFKNYGFTAYTPNP